jgi:hypothetical protein
MNWSQEKIKKSVYIDMREKEIEASVLAYLKEFFSSFMLYKDQPVKKKIYSEIWAFEMYDKLSDQEKIAIYLQKTKKTLKN